MRDSLLGSVTSSVAFAHAQEKIMDQKKDNLINLLDSVLRRNKEGRDEDDVLLLHGASPG